MKKYLAIFAVLFTVILSSCSNDDIPVSQSITFKVNPSTVVSSLVEAIPGDLSSIHNGQLYVNLYVYNKAGILVASDIQKFSDYTHIMNSVQNLEEGDYTVVASTHIVRNDGFKCWDFSGEKNLSTFTVKDKGYVGGEKKILGLTAKRVHIKASTKEVFVNVECAGAVALVQVLNWNQYSNVKSFSLISNKSCDEVTFDYSGELNYSIVTSNYNFAAESGRGFIMAVWEYNSKYENVYGYTFMFPYTNITMAFAATTNSGSLHLISEPCIGNIEKGHTYWFACDVTDGETNWSDETGRAVSSAPVEALHASNAGTNNLLRFDSKARIISIAQ